MSTDLKTWQDSAQQCADPECVESTNGALTAEPDQDGDHRFYECTECGYAFGYEKVPTETLAIDSAGSCSVGIPEEVRRKASVGMEKAMAAEERKNSLPILQIGRRPE